jgi:hypothetical protein
MISTIGEDDKISQKIIFTGRCTTFSLLGGRKKTLVASLSITRSGETRTGIYVSSFQDP